MSSTKATISFAFLLCLAVGCSENDEPGVEPFEVPIPEDSAYLATHCFTVLFHYQIHFEEMAEKFDGILGLADSRLKNFAKSVKESDRYAHVKRAFRAAQLDTVRYPLPLNDREKIIYEAIRGFDKNNSGRIDGNTAEMEEWSRHAAVCVEKYG